MRLLIAFLLVLASFPLFAQQPGPRQSPPKRNYIAPLNRLPYNFQIDPHSGLQPNRSVPRRWRVPSAPQDDVCLTMHSIIVARPNRNSDEVRVRREQNCTMASVFKLKPASPKLR